MMNNSLPAILGGEPVCPEGPPGWPLEDEEVAASVQRAMASGDWGRYVGQFGTTLCERLAGLHDVGHVRLCASGTAAVELALRGLGVGPGDEVLMAAYDFQANFRNVLAVGARPVLVDVCRDDAQMDVNRLAEAASPQTRTVLVSHLHGGVVDMSRLRRLADDARWKILEDACQMPGAIVHGRVAGTWGDVGVLSFGGSKLLTAGRGGCLLTNHDQVAARVRLHVERGNDLSPLSEIQAALLPPQLDRLTERREQRAGNAARLAKRITPMKGLRPFPPARSRDAGRSEPDYYKFALWYDPSEMEGLSRESFAEAVRAEGVALWPAFPGLHRIHSAKRYRAGDSLDAASAADEQLLVLHHPVLLGDQDQLEQVVAALAKVACHAERLRGSETA